MILILVGFMLLILIAMMIIIVRKRNEHFLEKHPDVLRIRSILQPIFPELANHRLLKSDASYTLDKGDIYLCTDFNGRKYDDNMIIYVTLHELAHTLTPTIGHTLHFMETFKNLLNRAYMHGLYDPLKPLAFNYCSR